MRPAAAVFCRNLYARLAAIHDCAQSDLSEVTLQAVTVLCQRGEGRVRFARPKLRNVFSSKPWKV